MQLQMHVFPYLAALTAGWGRLAPLLSPKFYSGKMELKKRRSHLRPTNDSGPPHSTQATRRLDLPLHDGRGLEILKNLEDHLKATRICDICGGGGHVADRTTCPLLRAMDGVVASLDDTLR